MSKSRGERGNKTPSSNQNAPPVNNTIVAGRFTECDWNELVENESCEDFVWDIVNEVADNACNIIFENIVTDRVAPYAVFSAKELLLDLIEWQFLECDCGEHVSVESAWDEDDEPAACITDSWAQGAVPVVSSLKLVGSSPDTEITAASATPDPHLIDDNYVIGEVELENMGDVTEKDDTDGIKIEEIEKFEEEDQNSKKNQDAVPSTKELEPEKPLSPSPQKVTHHKAPRNQNRKTVYKKHKGSLPNFAPISLTPVTEDHPRLNTQGGNYFAPHHGVPLHSADSLFKNQHGRPPGIKEVVYDELGNVTHVQKINVGAIPDYRVRTKLIIEDNNNSSQIRLNKNNNNNNNNINIRRIKGTTTNNINNINAHRQRKPIKGVNPGYIMEHLNGAKSKTDETRARQHTPGGTLRTPLPPPLVDTIDVSEGVVVKEGPISRRGPKKQSIVYVDEHTLKPVQSGGGNRGRTLDVHDIINKTKPTLNSYSRSKPLPAILL